MKEKKNVCWMRREIRGEIFNKVAEAQKEYPSVGSITPGKSFFILNMSHKAQIKSNSCKASPVLTVHLALFCEASVRMPITSVARVHHYAR